MANRFRNERIEKDYFHKRVLLIELTVNYSIIIRNSLN